MKERLQRIIDARVSVPTWILLFISTGIAMAFIAYLVAAPSEIRDFSLALPFFHPTLWAVMLTVSGLLSGFWLARRNDRYASYSSFSSFVLWVFGALSFWATEGQATVVLIVIPLLVFHAYLFLAPTLREVKGL